MPYFFTKVCIVLIIYGVNIASSVSLEEDLSLTLDQKLILDKFRKSVSSKLPHDYMQEDIYLVRWLRAKKFSIQAAESMLFKNLRWRKGNRMDTILKEDFSDMEDDFKYYVNGFDKYGRPVAFWDMGALDIRKAVIAGKDKRLQRYLYRFFEDVTSKVRNMREKQGLNVTQYNFVLDMDGFSLTQHACLQCVPVFISFILTYENYYPGACDKIILINTPSAFEAILQVLKPSMSQLSRDTLHVYGTNREEWQKEVFNDIPRDQLPPSVGGTANYAD